MAGDGLVFLAMMSGESSVSKKLVVCDVALVSMPEGTVSSCYAGT